MRVFGNLMNRLHEGPQSTIPAIGMGCTILMFSDRQPATIIEVCNSRRIVIQEDFAKRIDNNGQSESQEYSYSPNPDAKKIAVTLRKNGRWVFEGETVKNGTGIMIGEREKYYDFGF